MKIWLIVAKKPENLFLTHNQYNFLIKIKLKIAWKLKVHKMLLVWIISININLLLLISFCFIKSFPHSNVLYHVSWEIFIKGCLCVRSSFSFLWHHYCDYRIVLWEAVLHRVLRRTGLGLKDLGLNFDSATAVVLSKFMHSVSQFFLL